MGGIASAAGTAANLMGAANLISNTQTQRRMNKRKNTVELENRKNLLREQLASRRTVLGAMGLSSSSMASTSADKLTKDYYNDTVESLYDYKSKQSENTYKRNSGLARYTNKILK